ncbi:MAG TPA: hypothetical protein VIU46_09025, partial [Gallionellaceae bacterium]
MFTQRFGCTQKLAPGAARHADYFLYSCKESNQRNHALLRQPAASFGWTDPSGAAELEQCSPKPPDGFIQPSVAQKGKLALC